MFLLFCFGFPWVTEENNHHWKRMWRQNIPSNIAKIIQIKQRTQLLKMANQSHYLSVMNMNTWYSQIQRYKLGKWTKNQDPFRLSTRNKYYQQRYREPERERIERDFLFLQKPETMKNGYNINPNGLHDKNCWRKQVWPLCND